MPRFLLILAFLAILGLPTQGMAQDLPAGTGVIHGSVFDSTMAEPLAGATIALWETTFQVRSDRVGRFEVTGVPVGEYSIVFFHPRMGNLGVSSGSLQVRVEEGDTTSVQLSTPSMPTILVNECLLETGDPTAASAVGRVVDGGEGVGMPGAFITLRWWDEARRAREVELETNREGWYRACGLEDGLRMSANATFLNMNSTRREFTAESGSPKRIDLLLGSYGDADVTGTVHNVESGDPVPGAEIRLLDTDHFTVTDERGNFRVGDVAPGEYTLEVAHIAFQPRVEAIDLGSELGVHLGIDLSAQAIVLDPIVVTVDQNTMNERLAMGGLLITNAELEPLKARSNTLADLLQFRHIPGLLVTRTEGQFCVEFASGQVRLMRFSPCASAMMYIDGARVADPTAVLDIQDDIIDRIVVFRPVEAGSLFGLGAAHGVILIYTKSGRARS